VTELEILIQNGITNLKDDNFEDALSFFEQALLLDPNNADLWNQKGVALRSLGRYNEASECYNKSLQLDPRDRASS
jgi:Flp pilus assembly protein TadD|tara:strand:- start:278 stop:505 length:228 start_codon:yes stop_codon:yes gene_type:complete